MKYTINIRIHVKKMTNILFLKNLFGQLQLFFYFAPNYLKNMLTLMADL